MRSPALTELFVALARARTATHRHTALAQAVQNSRFDEDQMRELRTLLSESSQAREPSHALRPITNPVQDCADLTPLAAGPTGSGKTMLTHAIAGELKGRPAVCLDAHRVLDSHMGETGNRLAKAFAACAKSGSVLVLEELDGFAEARSRSDGSGSTRENNRITIALMRLIESATFPIVATSNRPEIFDPALLRRFEFRVTVPPLLAAERRVVLHKMLGYEPAPDLIELPIHESVLRVNRLKRREFFDRKAA